jgi:DnaA family protein
MRQLILDLLPEEPPSFDNFVAGSNGEALTGLASWLAPANREPLFFLWGEAGAGKSHLLQASQAAYTRCASGPRSVGECRHGTERQRLRRRQRRSAQRLRADQPFQPDQSPARQRRTPPRGGQRAPATTRLREDLRTRLGSSLVYRLQPLSDAEKLAALAEQARARADPAAGRFSLPFPARTARHAQPERLADGHRPLLAGT